jgi:hypothetical protein
MNPTMCKRLRKIGAARGKQNVSHLEMLLFGLAANILKMWNASN